MDEQKVRRPRRTAEQKAADIDAKIQKLNEDLESIEARRTAANQEFDAKAAAVKERIAVLEQQKKDVLAPKTSAQTPQDEKTKDTRAHSERQQIRAEARGDRRASGFGSN